MYFDRVWSRLFRSCFGEHSQLIRQLYESGVNIMLILSDFSFAIQSQPASQPRETSLRRILIFAAFYGARLLAFRVQCVKSMSLDRHCGMPSLSVSLSLSLSFSLPLLLSPSPSLSLSNRNNLSSCTYAHAQTFPYIHKHPRHGKQRHELFQRQPSIFALSFSISFLMPACTWTCNSSRCSFSTWFLA